ncbi:phosphoesterase [Rheinheimera sp.]|uniref:phosphoesterase n=1 Tax=Rheinheimera sp. TaxID=1869214 RepID=UPI00307D3AEF
MTTLVVNKKQIGLAGIATLLMASCQQVQPVAKTEQGKSWLAGDHHVHTHYSVKWDNSVFPPAPVLGGDAKYSIPLNAQMASHYGLSWMVVTDHGGPNRAKLALEQAYPELVASRKALPQILQFYGMEFDVPGHSPGGRHASLIMPHRPSEAEQLYQIESRYNGRQGVPPGPEKAEDAFMLQALKAMNELPDKPLLLVNHPARLASGFRQYNKVTPAQLRDWQDKAPDVVIGMTGAEGHQAATLNPDGSADLNAIRGEYPDYPTMGGYDQMTARLGGVWDSLLSEGRHWWVTGVSDSHGHYTDGWADFWPGQYAKTYVYADKNYDSIFAALKAGQVFVTTGDLIDALFVDVAVKGSARTASAGQTLTVTPDDELVLRVRFRDPNRNNGGGFNPEVQRVDVIQGEIAGPAAERNSDEASQTKVARRFYPADWRIQDGYSQFELPLGKVNTSQYVRLRGTNNKKELEPEADAKGENPWSDLWFYSNPVFIHVTAAKN